MFFACTIPTWSFLSGTHLMTRQQSHHCHPRSPRQHWRRPPRPPQRGLRLSALWRQFHPCRQFHPRPLLDAHRGSMRMLTPRRSRSDCSARSGCDTSRRGRAIGTRTIGFRQQINGLWTATSRSCCPRARSAKYARKRPRRVARQAEDIARDGGLCVQGPLRRSYLSRLRMSCVIVASVSKDLCALRRCRA